MSQLLYKYFLKKTQLDHIATAGPEDDPYFETIPDNELHFYQRKGAKRRRKLPDFIPENDLRVLESVKKQAYRLDLQLSLCGYRLGWSGIIGIFPWVGDVITLFLALNILDTARAIEGGLPPLLESRMYFNIALDFGIGLIPFVGDVVNILYKCNSRNFVLLEQHLVKKYGHAAAAVPATTGTTEVKHSATSASLTSPAAAHTAHATHAAEEGYPNEKVHTNEKVPPVHPVPPVTASVDKT
ncbi:uncharacterized protein RJT21DRAFT_121135 [Scheffersomyces amazonensis]|uniref:uncharacterized protein n=1 Tax=Scheffersomyces amazonensis TaxID=1078765 RepID=UPI00315D3B56